MQQGGVGASRALTESGKLEKAADNFNNTPMIRRGGGQEQGAAADAVPRPRINNLVGNLGSDVIDADKAQLGNKASSEGIKDKIKKLFSSSEASLPISHITGTPAEIAANKAINEMAPISELREKGPGPRVPREVMTLLTSSDPVKVEEGKMRLAEHNIPTFISNLIKSADPAQVKEGISRLVKFEGKKDQMLGIREVENQQHMSKEMATNNIGTLLGGVGKIVIANLGPDDQAQAKGLQTKLQSAQKRIDALERAQGILSTDVGSNISLNESGLKMLLASDKPEDVKLGKEAIKAICDLSANPRILTEAIKSSGLVATSDSLESGTMKSIEAQTSLIKFSRNIVAKTVFQSLIAVDLNKDMATVLTVPKTGFLGSKGATQPVKLANVPVDPKFPDGPTRPATINDFIANVGFNRLMSGNNDLGASLSSDVDFKLVFDDTGFKEALKSATPRPSPKQIDELTAKVQKQMNTTLTAAKTDFFEEDNNKGGLNLTLEVAKFTVKNLSTLAVEARTDEKEKNFLATVLHNSTMMSGNPSVMSKFMDIVDKNLGNIPSNWKEMISVSPKSSEGLKTAHDVGIVKEKIVNLAGKDIGLKKELTSEMYKNPELRQLVINMAKSDPNVIASKLVLSDPNDFARLFHNPAMFGKILTSPEILTKLSTASPDTMQKIETKILDFNKVGIAARNFNQNLGDSDKGSIAAIKNMVQIDNVVKVTAKAITDTPVHSARAVVGIMAALKEEADALANSPAADVHLTDYFTKELKVPTAIMEDPAKLGKFLADSLGSILENSPLALKGALGHKVKEPPGNEYEKSMEAAVSSIATVSDAVERLGMFDGQPVKDKLSLAVGLAKTFTKYDDDSGGTKNTSMIGKTGVTEKTDNWMYSVKFSGCRLNDMFDMVPKAVFTSSFSIADQPTAAKQYDDSKLVAGALNQFAVQIQDRTYEHYSKERTETHPVTGVVTTHEPLKHTEMDTKYDRITAKEFGTMMVDPALKANFQTMMTSMTEALAKLPPTPPPDPNKPGPVDDLRSKISAQIKVVNNINIAMDPKKLKVLTDEQINTPPTPANHAKKTELAAQIQEIIALKNKIESPDMTQRKEVGFQLFNALSKITEASAKHIEIH